MKTIPGRQNEIYTISLEGRLDEAGAMDLSRVISESLQKNDRYAVIDMAGVPYLSSAGIRVILSLLKQLNKRGGSLELSEVQDYPRKVLDMAGLLKVINIHSTVSDAVRACRVSKSGFWITE